MLSATLKIIHSFTKYLCSNYCVSGISKQWLRQTFGSSRCGMQILEKGRGRKNKKIEREERRKEEGRGKREWKRGGKEGLKSATVRVLTPLTDCKQGPPQGLTVKHSHQVLTKEIKWNGQRAQKGSHTYMDTGFFTQRYGERMVFSTNDAITIWVFKLNNNNPYFTSFIKMNWKWVKCKT